MTVCPKWPFVFQSLLTLVLILSSETVTYTRVAEAHYVPVVASPAAPTEATECTDDQIRCNCYLFVKTLIPDLPRTKDIYPNSPPKIGAVALFTYPNGLRHYAYIIGLGGSFFRVQECNHREGVCGEREVSYDDPRIDGYYWHERQTP